MKIKLPIQIAPGFPLRIRRTGDASGGWSVVECDTVQEARDMIAANPQASMPCWQNPTAAWNRADARTSNPLADLLGVC